MIRYVPQDIAKDVTAFVEKSCKDTAVHKDEASGRVAIATTSSKDMDAISKKFAAKGFTY
ncbi:hypothetical protein [Sphingomicrobium aestuariivivum]|uniref:hypothetical protein n=1 Tax=Sphingomicrobium aestuariivivum TaxID=1582356 RepID=UPI001FD64479|nr:hypothetical protein [Sphingomicrobium aestuariivivum]MCJ8191005.1 hypothetical protein [Sphingomicrobium aestuariivivum]